MYWLKWIISGAGFCWLLWNYRALNFPALAGQSGPDWMLFCFALLAAGTLYFVKLSRLRMWCESVSPKKLPRRVWIKRYMASVYWGTLTPGRLGDFTRIELFKALDLSRTRLALIVLLDKLADIMYVACALYLSADVLFEVFQLGIGKALALSALISIAYIVFGRVAANFVPARQFAFGIALSLFAFIFFMGSNIAVFAAAGADLLSSEVAAIVICSGALASLPVSMGGLGVREASLAALLQYFDVPQAQGALIVLLEFIVNVIFPLTLYGIIVSMERLSGPAHPKSENA